MKEQIVKLIGLLIFTAATIAVCFVGINKFAALKQKEIENEARFQCAQSSRYQIQQSNDVIVWYPVNDLYIKCLNEKGM